MKEFNRSDCIPFEFTSLWSLSKVQGNLTICNNRTTVLDENDFHWRRFSLLAQNCQKPCEAIEYKGEPIRYDGWSEPGKLTFSVFFSMNEIKIQEEYLVYNAVDLVGIVGGNLGLFIGFSFYDKIKQVITFVIEYLVQ